MSTTLAKKLKRKALTPATPDTEPVAKKTNLVLSGNCLAALARLKTNHGMTNKFAIERGVILLEQLTKGTK